MTDVVEKCKQVFAKVMEVDPSKVTMKSDPDNLEEWDSLSHVQMVLELEKAFAISIPPDEAIELEDFKMVTEIVAAKLGN